MEVSKLHAHALQILVRMQNYELQLKEISAKRVLITASIQKGLIYVMLGEKQICPEPEGKRSEKICYDSSVTELSCPVHKY